MLVPRLSYEENRTGVAFPAGVDQTSSLRKRGRKRREAALAEPTLLPGVCPRSDVIKLDARGMRLVAGDIGFALHGAKFL